MPKRIGFLYEKMLDKTFISNSILKSAKGKKNRREVKKILNNIEYYTNLLFNLLKQEKYIPSKPKQKEIFDQSSQKYRQIEYTRFFPDQIIQYMIVDIMQPIFMKHMYPWSCASLPNRGGSRQSKYLKNKLINDKKGTKYCLYLDINKYFPSINKEIIIKKIEHKIKDGKMIKLIKDIIYTCDKGLGIGYYLNQWLANFYLEDTDWFINSQKGVKYYCRYMDNLTILGPNKKLLHEAKNKIIKKLQEENLKINNDWQIFLVDKRMINSVGLRFNHKNILLRKKTKLKFVRQCKKIIKKQANRKKIPYHQATSLLSKNGFLHQFNSSTIKKKYFSQININLIKEVVRNESKK